MPTTLNIDRRVHVSCEQRLLNIPTMPVSAYCLQYMVPFPPLILMFARLVQEPCEQSLLTTCTMPESACCLKYLKYPNVVGVGSPSLPAVSVCATRHHNEWLGRLYYGGSNKQQNTRKYRWAQLHEQNTFVESIKRNNTRSRRLNHAFLKG